LTLLLVFRINISFNIFMLYIILKCRFRSAIGFIFTIIFGPLLFIEFMIEKKQLRAIFLYEFKLGIKQQRLLVTSTAHLVRKSQTNIRCNVGFKNFGMEMRALKMKKVMDIQFGS